MHQFKRSKRLLLLAVSALAASLAVGVAQGGADEGAPPPTRIMGGWEVTGHQELVDGGATTYHYERGPSEASGVVDAEIQWHRSSAAVIGQQLEGQGLQPAGAMATSVADQFIVERVFAGKIRESDAMFVKGTAQVYAAPQTGSEFFRAAGVWEEGGFTYVVSAQVPSLYMLERLLERVERRDGEGGPGAAVLLRRLAHRHHGARRHSHHHYRVPHHKRSGKAAH
jgi:hypothetical protein